MEYLNQKDELSFVGEFIYSLKPRERTILCKDMNISRAAVTRWCKPKNSTHYRYPDLLNILKLIKFSRSIKRPLSFNSLLKEYGEEENAIQELLLHFIDEGI